MFEGMNFAPAVHGIMLSHLQSTFLCDTAVFLRTQILFTSLGEVSRGSQAHQRTLALPRNAKVQCITGFTFSVS